jgi:hypothetical protein
MASPHAIGSHPVAAGVQPLHLLLHKRCHIPKVRVPLHRRGADKQRVGL